MKDQHHTIQRRMIDVIDSQLMGAVRGSCLLNDLDLGQLHAVRRFILSFVLLDDDHAIDLIPVEPQPDYPSKVGEWRDAPEAPEDFQRGFQAWALIVNAKLHELERKLVDDVNRALRAISEEGLTTHTLQLYELDERLDRLEETETRHTNDASEQIDKLAARLDQFGHVINRAHTRVGELSDRIADEERRLTNAFDLVTHRIDMLTKPPAIPVEKLSTVAARPGDKVLLMANTRTMGGAVLKEQWAKVLHVDTENGRYQVELGNTLGTETRSIPWVDFRYIKDVSPAIDVRFSQEKLD